MISRRLRLIASLVVLVASAKSALAQSVIELRSNAKVASGTPITLSQVAILTGSDAEAFGGVAISTPANGQKAITIQDVRRALDGQGRVNWGRIMLRGSRCSILMAEVSATKTIAAQKAKEPQAKPVDPNSVRAAVSERIGRMVQAEPANLRLSFSPEDDEFLNATLTGRTLELKPTASSDKLPMALTIYEKDRIVGSRNVRVGVLVRKTVVIAAVSKSRGETIDRDDVTADEQWVGPNVKAAPPDQVIGSAAQGKIATGQIIGISDVAPAIIVTKGEQVAISCVSGSIVLTTKARAMASGRIGEVIQFQALDDKRTFFARMNGRGRAVVTVEAAPLPIASTLNSPENNP